MSKITRNIGSQIILTGGEDVYSPCIEIVESRYHDKLSGDKAIMIEQSGQKIELSLESLEWICSWARGNEPSPMATLEEEEVLKRGYF